MKEKNGKRKFSEAKKFRTFGWNLKFQNILAKYRFWRRFPWKPAPFKKIKWKYIRKLFICYRRGYEITSENRFLLFVKLKWGSGNYHFSAFWGNRQEKETQREIDRINMKSFCLSYGPCEKFKCNEFPGVKPGGVFIVKPQIENVPQ